MAVALQIFSSNQWCYMMLQLKPPIAKDMFISKRKPHCFWPGWRKILCRTFLCVYQTLGYQDSTQERGIDILLGTSWETPNSPTKRSLMNFLKLYLTVDQRHCRGRLGASHQCKHPKTRKVSKVKPLAGEAANDFLDIFHVAQHGTLRLVSCCWYHILVGGNWNMTFVFCHHIGNVIIPTDELICFKMVIAPPTR